MHLQVEVRKAAPKRIQQIRQEIEAIAAGNAPAAEGAADSTLSAQLEAAVNTLGQGLVERDTEVATHACSICACWPAW